MKFIIIGIVFLVPSVLERVFVEGPHFGGVYGILIGAFFIFLGIDEVRKKQKKS